MAEVGTDKPNAQDQRNLQWVIVVIVIVVGAGAEAGAQAGVAIRTEMSIKYNIYLFLHSLDNIKIFFH